MATEISERVREIAQERGMSESAVVEQTLERGIEDLWQEPVVSMYFDGELEREQAVDQVGHTTIEREQEEAEMGRKKRGRKPKPPEEVELPDDSKANTTDPESQTLKTSNGWVQGYNGQTMVDCDNQIIVAQDITTDANDVQQL